MIIPCIDLMGGKAVQLVQGRDKALEADALEMVEKFCAFPQLQLIDLDAATGAGSNDYLVARIATSATCRIGGGVRNAARAAKLIEQGAYRVIVGTAAFNRPVLEEIAARVGRERVVIALDSRGGRIVINGWRESTPLSAEEVIRDLELYCSGFLCTFVDKEGMMQGTDLNWFRRLRSATDHELTAAGGITTIEEIEALDALRIHAALGMAIYRGRLNLSELAQRFSHTV